MIFPRVVAAAIKGVDGVVYSVAAPGRHHNIIKLMDECGIPFGRLEDQGFLLSNGEFVDRQTARAIATAANQGIERDMKLVDLYSEDVW